MINVSVKDNGGFLPESILLTLCNYVGEPFQYHHVEFLSLQQPMFPPKPFDCSVRRFFSCVQQILAVHCFCFVLKKNQNAPRPSELAPVRGGGVSKRLLGGNKGCKYKTSSWHLKGFPDGNKIGSTV